MSQAIPKDKRQLRACLMCSLIKNSVQFKQNGCENCEQYLRMRGHSETVMECTSPVFDGLIALMNPSESWVARYNHIDKYVPGIYASFVSGRLPPEAESRLERFGITYHPRDGTADE
ncbi:transcription elongation factor spt4 [Spiromyces aspiralis]|uniref:Transcription elongation factor spt4 n=1 Tax=Spiromyces aspiralis TaxID=68401 RepID=A0ACC1HMB7_9FUNG|nr:transcription elongation factor spt4 [Spiromyces aspiralis]